MLLPKETKLFIARVFCFLFPPGLWFVHDMHWYYLPFAQSKTADNNRGAILLSCHLIANLKKNIFLKRLIISDEMHHLLSDAPPEAQRGQRLRWPRPAWVDTSWSRWGAARSPGPVYRTALFGGAHFCPTVREECTWKTQRWTVTHTTNTIILHHSSQILASKMNASLKARLFYRWDPLKDPLRTFSH